MAKAKKATKKENVQAEANNLKPGDEGFRTPDGYKMLSWSLGGADAVKFLHQRPTKLSDLLDPNFGGRSAPMAASERAIVDKYFGQWCVEERRMLIDEGLFGTEEAPVTPDVETVIDRVNNTTVGETRAKSARAKKVAKTKASDLPEDPAERLARLEAMYVEQEGS